jgi:hypothetical protein
MMTVYISTTKVHHQPIDGDYLEAETDTEAETTLRQMPRTEIDDFKFFLYTKILFKKYII